MRFLLATTAAGAIAAGLATPAYAQTVITTATTAPASTSATGDLRVSTTGSIRPAGGAAVTVNSNADVKNEGTVGTTGANGSTGILANANLTGDIANIGTITIDETFTATDSDSDGDLDGPFAQGSNRFGIRLLGGGTFTGTLLNSGTITVEGNQSAGIAVDGALAGSLTNSGRINVIGNDSVGIRTAGVSGTVNIASGANITAQGQNSVGVLLGGNLGGALLVQGSITSTGYRSTIAPADPSKLDADDLLQGGSALVVAGNVAGGILLDARPADNSTTDTDEDDDGIADANETTASVTSYGAAPALRIGSAAQDVAIGAVASNAYGLVIKGTVSGLGVYKGVDATGISIGGTGHSVALAGGMSVSGAVRALAVEADATAVRIGAGASAPAIAVSGSVSAESSGGTGSNVQAIVIDTGASVGSILNSGAILAEATDALGSASAIVDHSGTLSLVENSGAIIAFGGGQVTAIDLSANSGGAIVRQLAAASGKPASQINGDILLGSGNDTVAILGGSVTGDIDFGGGADLFTLGGTYRGHLLDSAGVAVSVGSGGLLDAKNLGTVTLGSLTTSSGAALGVTIGGTGHTLYNIVGEANFGTGTTVAVTIDEVAGAAGIYTIVDAGTLTGAGNLSSSVVTVPFLFNSTLTSTSATGEVRLEVAVKDAVELGLNASETAIFGAALGAVDADQPVASVFLGAEDAATLKDTLQQLMPEHAGGAFESVSRGSQLAGELLADPRPLASNGTGLWMQQFGWNSTKAVGSTANFNVSGWGAAAGYERRIGGLGSLGVTAVFSAGRDSKSANELVSDHFEGGIYWRGGVGPLRAFARAAAGTIQFDGTRNFRSTVGDTPVARSAEGEWSGRLYSGLAGVSYELRSGRLSIRPSASVDYAKLTEKGYSETGGGAAFDLTVLGRKSSETAANALLALGYDLMGGSDDSGWFRFEVQGGRREVLSGSLGETRASFGDGTLFTLAPEERDSGWRGGLRLTGGGTALSVAAEIGAEEVQGRAAVNGRIGINLAM